MIHIASAFFAVFLFILIIMFRKAIWASIVSYFRSADKVGEELLSDTKPAVSTTDEEKKND
jgi:hypothetical protein